MDSNTPADPWDIPATATEPVAGVVAVADDETDTEPAVEDAQDSPITEPVEEDVPTSEEPSDESPADVAAPVTDDPGAPVELDTEDAISVSDDVDSPVAEHRFDLGLEADEPWSDAEESFESGTAFDLIPPSTEAAGDEPDYEVAEPELSETFVTSAGSGRPDHSLPQLRDPAPMFAVPEDDEEPPVTEEAQPSVEVTEPEPRGFRLPGLSFGRRTAPPTEPVDEAPTSDEVPEPPEHTDEAVPEAGDPFAEVVAEEPTPEAPSTPSAWADVPEPGSSDPDSPFAHAEPVPTDEAEVEETPVEEPPGEEPEAELEAVAVEVEDEPDVAGATEDSTVEEAEMTETETETETDFELTDPNISEVLDAAELYVTETVPKEERPPALLTVDSVPGATIAQAVDVVNAVASASDEVDLAAALDRTMEQLRAKAVEFGGDAVISVRTEVQEMGGGFLVTASGTVVTLA